MVPTLAVALTSAAMPDRDTAPENIMLIAVLWLEPASTFLLVEERYRYALSIGMPLRGEKKFRKTMKDNKFDKNIFVCRVDELDIVHEQCDPEQTNDEDSESLSEDEYKIADDNFIPAKGGSHLEQSPNRNVQDPLELPVIENKHQVGETIRTDDNAGNASVKDDAVIEIFESFEEVKDEIDDETAQPISGSVQADGNAGNEGNEDDSEIEMYLSYEELKEETDDETAQPISGSDQADGNADNEGEELKDEPYDMQRLQESLDISGDSDCVIVGGYVEDKVEVEDDETN